MFRRLFKGECPDPDVKDKTCPKMFFDPELQAVQVGDEHFPIHLVAKFRRAKAA